MGFRGREKKKQRKQRSWSESKVEVVSSKIRGMVGAFDSRFTGQLIPGRDTEQVDPDALGSRRWGMRVGARATHGLSFESYVPFRLVLTFQVGAYLFISSRFLPITCVCLAT